ncbi:hypothetical protein HDU96_001441 [Phlyctochytrium bullatum]|nr:hypothetical protein HDU96_001441 [Phlyctochytrium bullatum]
MALRNSSGRSGLLTTARESLVLQLLSALAGLPLVLLAAAFTYPQVICFDALFVISANSSQFERATISFQSYLRVLLVETDTLNEAAKKVGRLSTATHLMALQYFLYMINVIASFVTVALAAQFWESIVFQSICNVAQRVVDTEELCRAGRATPEQVTSNRKVLAISSVLASLKDLASASFAYSSNVNSKPGSPILIPPQHPPHTGTRSSNTDIEHSSRQPLPAPTGTSEAVRCRPSTVPTIPDVTDTNQIAKTSFNALPGYLGADAPDASIRDRSASALQLPRLVTVKTTASDVGDLVKTLVAKGVDYFFQRYSVGRNDHAHASYFSTITAAATVVLLQRTMADQKGADWPLLVSWEDGLAVGGIYLAGEVVLEWILTFAEARNGIPVGSVPDLACTFRIVGGLACCVGFVYGAFSGVNRMFDIR